MALYAGFACPRELKQRLTSKEWAELQTLATLETVGPDRRDRGVMLAAIGMMSASGAKLNDFDPTNLLPNKRKEESDPYETLLAFSQQHNAKWQNQSER